MTVTIEVKALRSERHAQCSFRVVQKRERRQQPTTMRRCTLQAELAECRLCEATNALRCTRGQSRTELVDGPVRERGICSDDTTCRCDPGDGPAGRGQPFRPLGALAGRAGPCVCGARCLWPGLLHLVRHGARACGGA